MNKKILIIIGLLAGMAFQAKTQTGWSVSPTQFQNNMTVLSMLNIEGEISSDINDQIGVFSGSECRGVSNVSLQEGKYYALLTIWSNASSDEVLTVKIYDASSNKIYDLKQTISFVKDEVLGSYSDPVVFYTNLNQKKISAYNFFSPNNDGKNDYFVVDDLTALKGLTLKVLTLKGVEVFKQKDYDNTWQGVNKDGKDLPKGTYYYLFVDDSDKTIYSGSITLVR